MFSTNQTRHFCVVILSVEDVCVAVQSLLEFYRNSSGERLTKVDGDLEVGQWCRLAASL